MDLHTIRQLLKTKSIYDIPLRVTFYARVSSESDEQLNSLSNQIAYYENKIKQVGCWTFVPGYIDEGISGMSTKKREDFNRMMDDAAQDMFDLIITKEISRFARNTVDSISFTRQLQRCGVGVFFENCENVTLQNVDFFDSGAMVVVGQLSKDTTLDGVRIRLRKETEKGYDPKRVVSCSADATHFVCCMGKLEIKNCVFENMLDDISFE